MRDQYAEDLLKEAIKGTLTCLGVDLSDQNFKRTPERVARFLQMFAERSTDLESLLEPQFEEPYNELVMVRGIRFVSLCAHHMLPFTGKAAVGYIPEGRVVGISKLARLSPTSRGD